MGTYDIKKVLSDYERGSMPVEMAQGHSLQHIAMLYELHQTIRAELRTQTSNLGTKLATLQSDVDRLTSLVKKL